MYWKYSNHVITILNTVIIECTGISTESNTKYRVNTKYRDIWISTLWNVECVYQTFRLHTYSAWFNTLIMNY